MRYIFAVALAILVVLASANISEAKRRSCTCANGTQFVSCPIHRNDCFGLSPHQHENNRVLYAHLPTFCEVHGEGFLIQGGTCKDLRKQLREAHGAARNHARAADRARRNSPVGIIEHRINQNTRRIENRIQREMRRDLHRMVDRAMGIR